MKETMKAPEGYEFKVVNETTVRLEKIEKIEELKRFVEEQDNNNEEDDLVPENITIERDIGNGDCLGIVFNREKQTLYYNENNDIFDVRSSCPRDFVQCKLVKINKEERKIGYTYFRTDNEDTNTVYFFFFHKNKLDLYCKYLGNNKHVYINNDEDIITSNTDWDNWYQVIPVEEQ